MRGARWMLVGLLGLLSIGIACCAPAARDAGADAQAIAIFDDLRHHRDGALEGRLDQNMRGSGLSDRLIALQEMLPPGEPASRREIATREDSLGNSRAISTIDAYTYGDRTVVVETRQLRREPGGDWRVQGFQINVATSAELAANDFALGGKSIAQYVFLLGAVATPAMMLAAIVKVLATGGMRRKWLWCLVACFGVCGLQMNWRTGAVQFLPLTVQFLGVGFWRQDSPFSPWILTTCLPLGAATILAGATTMRRTGGTTARAP